jgi:fructoselysine-6-P-deglycase FrlB-like protein
MKNLFLVLLIMSVICPMSACSDNNDSIETDEEQTNQQPDGQSNILVVYFSQSGTTRGVAERIGGCGLLQKCEE